MDNYGKFGNKLLFIELCSFFIDLLAFELGKLCPGVGIFVLFFQPWGWSFALNSCPRFGILTEKISGLGVSLGGMVTSQIDACITLRSSRYKCTWVQYLVPLKVSPRVDLGQLRMLNVRSLKYTFSITSTYYTSYNILVTCINLLAWIDTILMRAVDNPFAK